jgi:biopolymer transport protein ExbD
MKKFTVEKGSWDDISEINIVPLADLSLVLLIVLMIISPMIMQSMIKVYASGAAVAAAAEEKKEQEKPLFIQIKKNGFLLNTKALDSEDSLFIHLKGELSRKTDKTVMITVDKGVTHGTVVHVLDLTKQAGADKLSLIKRLEKT